MPNFFINLLISSYLFLSFYIYLTYSFNFFSYSIYLTSSFYLFLNMSISLFSSFSLTLHLSKLLSLSLFIYYLSQSIYLHLFLNISIIYQSPLSFIIFILSFCKSNLELLPYNCKQCSNSKWIYIRDSKLHMVRGKYYCIQIFIYTL